MTSGVKVEFGAVRSNRPSSATNNCIDEAQLGGHVILLLCLSFVVRNLTC